MSTKHYCFRWDLAEAAADGGFPEMIIDSNKWTKATYNFPKIMNCPLNLWDADVKAILKTLKERNDTSKLIDFIKNIKKNIRDGKGLTLLGANGIGKTAIIIQILRSIMKTFNCFFIESYQVRKLIRDSWKNKSKEDFKNLVSCSDNDVLVFDDLLKIEKSEEELEEVWSIFYQRYNDKKSTFFTANVAEEYLEENHYAAYSRMKDVNTILYLTGEDYRKKDK